MPGLEVLADDPCMHHIQKDAMYARHPAQRDPNTGRRFVPAVSRHPDHGPSIYLYSESKYGNALLPDGKTIEYRASNNAAIDGALGELVGKHAVLYLQVGSGPRAKCRQGRVAVSRPSAVGGAGGEGDGVGEGVYHLRLRSAPLWADLTDDL